MTVRTLLVALAVLVAGSSGFASGEAESVFTVTTFSEASELTGQAFENSALGQDGTAYYTDHVAHVIRAVDLATGEVALVAGTEGTSGFQDGDLSTALLFQPRGACISPCDGHLYFVDGGGALLRQLNFKQRTIVTVAGAPGQKGFHDGAGPAARFSFARAPLCLANGTILVADTSSHPALRTVDPPTGAACGHPTPKPAPSPPPPNSATDMLVHKLVLVGACSVLAIIAAFMFVKVHAGAWVRASIDGMRARNAGPPRTGLPPTTYPDIHKLRSDEESGSSSYQPPALPASPFHTEDLPASRAETPLSEGPADLIALSPATPSSPCPSALPPVSLHSSFTSQHLPAASSSASGSSSSSAPVPSAVPSASASSVPPAPKPDPFADLVDLA